MKYFHINYIARTNWFAPILERFHSTENSHWPAEYALGLNTKFEILEFLRSDINRAIADGATKGRWIDVSLSVARWHLPFR
jgi:hypothetical protein